MVIVYNLWKNHMVSVIVEFSDKKHSSCFVQDKKTIVFSCRNVLEYLYSCEQSGAIFIFVSQ